jgi:hypothetical protein
MKRILRFKPIKPKQPPKLKGREGKRRNNKGLRIYDTNRLLFCELHDYLRPFMYSRLGPHAKIVYEDKCFWIMDCEVPDSAGDLVYQIMMKGNVYSVQDGAPKRIGNIKNLP